MIPTLRASSEVTTQIELYDQDVKDITDGPLAWANKQVGTRRNIDDFHKGLTEQFDKINLKVDVNVYTMGECRCHPPCRDAEACRHLVPVEDAYIFQCAIIARHDPESGFDFDQLQHEIRNNLLDIPGEGGTIKFDEAEFLRQHGGGKHGHPH